MKLFISRFSVMCRLGMSEEEVIDAFRQEKFPELEMTEGYLPGGVKVPLGRVNVPFTPSGSGPSRNDEMISQAVSQIADVITEAKKRFTAERVGAVIGTSNLAVSEVEQNIVANSASPRQLCYDARLSRIGDLSGIFRKMTGCGGPVYTVATACSSSARAFISAARLIEAGICDAVVVAGTDTLSRIAVAGFESLGVLSLEPCLPFHRSRSGMNIGEGTAMCVLSHEMLGDRSTMLMGYGASSDGYHISSPEPTGTYAAIAMKDALKAAGLKSSDIGYVCLHGTGTKLNDGMEAKAVAEVFPDVPASSIKHLTGHTLGASGILSEFICSLVARGEITLPFHPYDSADVDPVIPEFCLVTEPDTVAGRPYTVSNAFAFGGNNAVLVTGPCRE